MWILLSDQFFSIVHPLDMKPDQLLVRARRKGDLESIWPDAVVERTPGRDYLWRTVVSRSDVAKALVAQVEGLDYPNVKDSISDPHLHVAAADTWQIFADLQEVRPYSTQTRPGFRKHPKR